MRYDTTEQSTFPPGHPGPVAVPPGSVRCLHANGQVVYLDPADLIPGPTVQPPAGPAPIPGVDIPGIVHDPRSGLNYYGYVPTAYPEVKRVGVDPVAQRLVGIGAAAAGTGWGVGEVVNALAGATSSVALVVAGLVAWKFLPSGSRPVVNQRTEITNHNTATGLFGRASSNTSSSQSHQ